MPELILFIGLQGAGKSSFYRARFAATHNLVSKDVIPNVRNKDERQHRLIEAAFQDGQDVVVDNTHLTREVRARVIAQAIAGGARVAAYFFEPDLAGCQTRNATRIGRANVPSWVIDRAHYVLEPPSLDEGLDEIIYVRLRDGEFQISPEPFP